MNEAIDEEAEADIPWRHVERSVYIYAGKANCQPLDAILSHIRSGTGLAKSEMSCTRFDGEKDLQVPSKENLAAIAKALKKGGNKNVSTKEFPGLNHLFRKLKQVRLQNTLR
ncbi:MAG: hypothetical protein R2778_07030 [Saprospiraceae bacterium]